MFLAKKILAGLLLPPAVLLVLALAGLGLAGRRPRLGRALATLACAALLLLSEPWLARRLMAAIEAAPPATTAELAAAQAIIILGGGSYRAAPEYGGADTVSRFTLERLRYGAFLERRTGLPILVTGGAPYGGRPEAEAMREALERDFGVPVRWVEGASRDTAENASLSAPLLRQAGIGTIVLVTQAFHMKRAAAWFRRQGFVVIAAPTGFTVSDGLQWVDLLPSAGALEASSLAIHEWVGCLVGKVA